MLYDLQHSISGVEYSAVRCVEHMVYGMEQYGVCSMLYGLEYGPV